MKFLQIHTFYRRYLNEFYSRHPHLGRAPFHEQIKALAQNGFGAGHVFVPYLRELGYDAHFVVGNCPQAQAQWAREHDFFSVTPQNWELEIARRQVETLKPDILFLRNPLTFDSHFLRSLSWKPALIVGWQAAAIPAKTDWSLFDVIMSSSRLCLQEAAALGAQSTEYFFPGFPSWIADACRDESQKWDVVFSGQWTHVHNRRNQLLQEVAKVYSGSGGEFSCGFFIDHSPAETLPAEVSRPNQGARWGLEMFRALKSGRIVLNASGDAFQDEAPNMRLFEVTGVGAFLLTDYQHNIQQFFVPGIEIETFRDNNELIEKIDYYLKHLEQREAIARRGQERCLREYSMPKRAKEFDAIIRKHLKHESSPSFMLEKDMVNEVESLLQYALGRLNAFDYEPALHLFDQAIKARPDLPQIRYGKVVALARSGRAVEAIEELKSLLAKQPDHQKARFLLDELNQILEFS